MEKFKKIIKYLGVAFVFLLPLQTRWIFSASESEYRTLGLYGTEILFGAIMLLSIIYFLTTWVKKHRSIEATKQSGKKEIIIILILIGTLLSNVWGATDQSIAFYKFSQIISAAALFALIVALKPAFSKISSALILSGVWQSLFAIQQFLDQKIIANKWLGMAAQAPQTLGVPVVEADGTRWLRAFGTLPHPNILAGFLIVSLILIIGSYTLTQHKRWKKILPLFFILNSIALFTTLSRAAILTFVILIILLPFLARKQAMLAKSATKFALIFLCVTVLFTVMYPSLIFSRASGNSYVENVSNTTRVEQYREFGAVIKQNWLTGVGLGNYPAAIETLKPNLAAWTYQPIHNTYLLIFAELGLLGLGAIILLIIFIALQLRRVNISVQRITAITCLTGITLLALFDHYLWSFYFGLMLTAIIFALEKNAAKTIVVSGPVIIEKEKVLLIRDKKDEFWKFPGGRVEEIDYETKEPLLTACQRETKEEIGLNIEIIRPLRSLIVDKPDGTAVELNHFLAKSTGAISLSTDIKESRWHQLNNLPNNCAPNIKPIIDDFQRFAKLHSVVR